MPPVVNQAKQEPNPFEVLRLRPEDVKDLPLEKVKSLVTLQYRQESLVFHPDKPHGNESTFKAFSVAYNKLSSSDKALATFLRAFLSPTDEQTLVTATISRMKREAKEAGGALQAAMEGLEMNYFGALGIHHGRALTIHCAPYCVAITNDRGINPPGSDDIHLPPRRERKGRSPKKPPQDEYDAIGSLISELQFHIMVDENHLVHERAGGRELRRPDKVIIGTLTHHTVDTLKSQLAQLTEAKTPDRLTLAGAKEPVHPADQGKIIIPVALFREHVQARLSAELIPDAKLTGARTLSESSLISAQNTYLVSCVHPLDGKNHYYVLEGYIGHEGKPMKGWFTFL